MLVWAMNFKPIPVAPEVPADGQCYNCAAKASLPSLCAFGTMAIPAFGTDLSKLNIVVAYEIERGWATLGSA